jgi:putative transcriptional regulator
MPRAKKPTVGEEIIAGAREALQWVRGENPPGVKVRTFHVPNIDVRSVRLRMKLTQDEFAARFGFQRASLRKWEQGRRAPEGPARVLLAVIAKHPEAVEDALRHG